MSDPGALVALDDQLPLRLATAVGADAETVTGSRDGDGVVCVDVPASAWTAAATFLRDRCGLDFLDWLSAVDQPDAEPPAVDVVLHLADSRSGGEGRCDPPRVRRALLRTRVPNSPGSVPSLTSVWPGVAWHERETFEMFGVTFDGFDDGSGEPLRPLLLPEGFEGNPLRKSFVLAARASKPWPGAKEPGESEGTAPSRRKALPPGVPESAGWGRETGTPPPPPEPVAAATARAARAARAGAERPARAAAERPARAPRTPKADAAGATAAAPAAGTETSGTTPGAEKGDH